MSAKRPISFLSFILIALPTTAVSAQPAADPETPPEQVENPTPAGEETAEEPVSETPATADKPAKAPAALSEAAEARFEAQQQRIDRLELELTDTRQQLESMQLEEMQELADIETDRTLSVYGFLDASFHKYFVDEGGLFDGLINEHPFFTTQNLNLYFASEMTETLSALAEIKFTYLPLGYERGLTVPGFTEYERTDTSVIDPRDNTTLRLGGISIERMHVTWQPADYFGVMVGRYLTPFGIWNIDHGSPVIISVRPPHGQTSRFVPLEQTGIQLLGQLYPASELFFDYALTLSNGRGPADSVIDYDDNKGLGLRLKLSHKGIDHEVAIGTYGYMGDFTDIEREVVSFGPFDVDEVVSTHYEELAGSIDLLLEYKDLRLQSEYFRRRVEYTMHGPSIFGTGPPGQLQPNFIQYDIYVMLAYTLPLESWLGEMKLTPYVFYEYAESDDSDDPVSQVINAGLNFKPSPYLVLKAEQSFVHQFNRANSGFSVFSLQLAVSF